MEENTKAQIGQVPKIACQPSPAPVTIREHVSSASMVHKCESQEVIRAILLTALSLSNVLSGENFSIVSGFKLR